LALFEPAVEPSISLISEELSVDPLSSPQAPQTAIKIAKPRPVVTYSLDLNIVSSSAVASGETRAHAPHTNGRMHAVPWVHANQSHGMRGHMRVRQSVPSMHVYRTSQSPDFSFRLVFARLLRERQRCDSDRYPKTTKSFSAEHLGLRRE
jgi:hypothetical protein